MPTSAGNFAPQILAMHRSEMVTTTSTYIPFLATRINFSGLFLLPGEGICCRNTSSKSMSRHPCKGFLFGT